MRPEGISLDQMMVALLRANPDAFINNNINLVKAGKILKAPERDQIAAIAPGDASQEVRVQTSNWNAYRAKVADTAPAVADAAPATKGKITARVEDKAAGTGSKDVVVLSKGEGAAGTGKDGKAADRVRALEEDLAARNKALTESKERVAQLEKTIKDMQKLAEIKNPAMAAAQQAGKGDAKADAKAAPKPEVKVEAPKADAPKAEASKTEPPKADTMVEAPKPAAVTPEAPKADPVAAPNVALPTPPAPAAPQAVAKAAPPPPAPGIMDTVMENILPIGGGAALLAGLAGLWAVRRRKKNDDMEGYGAVDEPAFAQSDSFSGNVGAVAVAADAGVPAASSGSEGVDPIEEAQVYIDHGRDTQAEDILREAMGKHPERQDVQLKLLEVYAARGDKGSFNKLAKEFSVLTGGVGENWDKATAMGRAVDPANALYPSTGEVVDLAAANVSDATVDLDIGATDNLSTTTDILLDQGGTDSSMDKTMLMTRGDVTPAAPAPAPEPAFNIELPPDTAAAEPKIEHPHMMDFNLDLPALDAAPAAPAVLATPATPAAKPAEDAGLDFKVDFAGINLNLDDKPAAGGEKDAHWNDVQQKFDLARAYQDMGDKDGAKEILREVVREGDAAQKTEAQKLLESIK